MMTSQYGQLSLPRIVHQTSDDVDTEEQFAELSLKLPGVRDVLVSPTNAVGSIVRVPSRPPPWTTRQTG